MIKRFYPHLLLLLANLIYGLNFTIVKEVMPAYIEPFAFIVLRCMAATLVFWLITLGLKNQKIPLNDLARIAICAVFGVVINQLCFFEGLQFTAPISGSIIMTTVPVWVLFLSFFILKNPINIPKVLGIILGIIGALILILSGKENANTYAPNPLWGNFLIFVNATSYAIYLILVKPLLAKYEGIVILKWFFLFGLIITLPFGWNQLTHIQWDSFTPHIWWSVAFVLVLVSCATYLFNILALKKLNPTAVSIYIYAQPFFAVNYAIFMGKDFITLEKFLAGILIFIGVYLVSIYPLQKPKNVTS